MTGQPKRRVDHETARVHDLHLASHADPEARRVLGADAVRVDVAHGTVAVRAGIAKERGIRTDRGHGVGITVGVPIEIAGVAERAVPIPIRHVVRVSRIASRVIVRKRGSEMQRAVDRRL